MVEDPEAAGLHLFGPEEVALVDQLRAKMAESRELAIAMLRCGDPGALQGLVQELSNQIANLPQDDTMFLPSGWTDGRTSDANVMLILHRTAPDTFSVVVCNPGDVMLRPDTGRREYPGLEYHPSSCDHPPKIKYRTCFKLDEVPQDKLTDQVFLAMLLNQRISQDESHRAVVFYDVLLPWVCGRAVLEAIDNTDPASEFRTPQRSMLSSYRSVLEAARYWLRHSGVGHGEVKQFLHGVRSSMLGTVSRDLLTMIDPTAAAASHGNSGLGRQLKPLLDCELVSPGGNTTLAQAAIENKVLGIYFSAHWCPPCRNFTPKLAALYRALKQQNQPFEVVFCSSDRNATEFQEYLGSMPWLAVPFEQQAVLKKLKQNFEVSGIPKLVLIDQAGQLISEDGRALVMADTVGANFPWSPIPDVADDLPADPAKLRASDVKLIEIACQQTVYSALKENTAGRLDHAALQEVEGRVGRVQELLAQIDVTGGDEGGLPLGVELDTRAIWSGIESVQHLISTGEDRYRGAKTEPMVPTFADLLKLPDSVQTIQEARTAIETCRALCDECLARADLHDSTASAQLVMQSQVVQLIGHLFTVTLPIPKPAHHEGHDLWSTAVSQSDQLELLGQLYGLQLMYTNMWQDIQEPPRSYCSERAVVCLALYAIFNAVIRTSATDGQLMVTRMLHADGGYALSVGLGRRLGTQSVDEASKSWELVTPSLAETRGAAVAYLMALERGSANCMLNLRMNPNAELEMENTDPCMRFLRSLVRQCGYPLMPRSMPPGSTEMHALMGWLSCEQGPFAQLSEEHPEFPMMRDMVCLWKFTTTMLTSAQEMMERRADTSTEDYHISFDQGSQRTARRGRSDQLRWMLTRVRGQTNNIADFHVRGFNRKLSWGSEKSKLICSPTDVAKYAKKSHPSEDDILWLEDNHLKEFVAGALSVEESERLLGYLTVEYVRIPLVASFFAEGDRAALLFAEAVQKLLSGTLLEQGLWAPADGQLVTRVPTRTNRQLEGARDYAVVAALIEQDKQVLGTAQGLLLNELQHSPQAVLTPLMHTLRYIEEVQQCSVHSVNASFIMFMIQLASNCEAYLIRTIENGGPNLEALQGHRQELAGFLRGPVLDILGKWLAEAEQEETVDGKRKGNQNTMVVIHSYIALLLGNLTAEEMNRDNLSRLLGSLAYVRTEHAYGTILRNLELNMIDNSSEIDDLEMQMLDMDEDERADAEKELSALRAADGTENTNGFFTADQKKVEKQVGMQLVRFLEAQGVNTENLDSERLKPYLTGEPLWFCQGNKVLRIPLAGFTKRGKQFKPPPMEVPEYQLFSLLQRIRRPVVEWLQSNPGSVSEVMCRVVSVALHSHVGTLPSDTKWVEVTRGVYHEPVMDIKMDVQAMEILSNNQETRPVPDSMTSFADFELVFGKEALRCSYKYRHEHRQWVSIVGEDHELLEWDAPDPTDQGIGGPVGLPGTQYPFLDGYLHRGVEYTRPFRYYLEHLQVPPPPPPAPTEIWVRELLQPILEACYPCLLYTSPSPRDS
eukprot:TRINITY_DN27556_c0_g1_i1.p1 TRINITY_DN27556_c0_g1~~TRINITY_DN27556_c0_g1_i1.p1  ORF type:complete len:1525 (-),score=378.05 TRINITY_DN27556_c0_g1_i1:111-4685(-)